MNPCYILLPLLILIALLFSVRIDIVFSQTVLDVRIFRIPVLIKREEGLVRYLQKLREKSDSADETKKRRSRSLLRFVRFRTVSLRMDTLVRDYALFARTNAVLLFFAERLYPLVRDRLPRLQYRFRASDANEISLRMTLNVNVWFILLEMMKGKIKNGRATNE